MAFGGAALCARPPRAPPAVNTLVSSCLDRASQPVGVPAKWAARWVLRAGAARAWRARPLNYGHVAYAATLRAVAAALACRLRRRRRRWSPPRPRPGFIVAVRCAPPSISLATAMEHPHGVQPALGVFGDGGDAAAALRSAGLGALACLPDEALLNILETLGPRDLAHLACASRACWVFCQHDELWKGLCLEVRRGPLRRGAGPLRVVLLAWPLPLPPQPVCIEMCRPPCGCTHPCRRRRGDGTSRAAGRTLTWRQRRPRTAVARASRAACRCRATCSTHHGCALGRAVLHRFAAQESSACSCFAPFCAASRSPTLHCHPSCFACVLLPSPSPSWPPCSCATAAVDPAWLEIDNVERRSGLSVAEFREQYELPNRPVILTDVVRATSLVKVACFKLELGGHPCVLIAGHAALWR